MDYSKEKQAETHYRNSIYNGHQLHRFHHRQYFNFVRQRKSPGRPPRSAESFGGGAGGVKPGKPGLMDNSLLNFSLSSFDLANGVANGLPTMAQMSQMIDPIGVEVKTEKPEDDKDVIEIIDVGASESISPTQAPQVESIAFCTVT